jgi:hypothetical protein
VVEWSAFLLPIQEVQRSDVGPKTCDPKIFIDFADSLVVIFVRIQAG